MCSHEIYIEISLKTLKRKFKNAGETSIYYNCDMTFPFFPLVSSDRGRVKSTRSHVSLGVHMEGDQSIVRALDAWPASACAVARALSRARPAGPSQRAGWPTGPTRHACVEEARGRPMHAWSSSTCSPTHFQWCSASLHLATFVAAVVVLIPCTPKPTTYSIHVCVRVARVGSVSHMQQQRLQRRIKHCLVAIDPRKSLLGWLGTTYTIEAFFKVVSSLVIVVTPTYIQLFF
jgi:hypothetical protein